MPDVSAAIVLLAGVLLTLSSVMGSSLTEDSRKRLAGWGWVLVTIGFVAWVFWFGMRLIEVLEAAFRDWAA
jgi:hypothetical protein